MATGDKKYPILPYNLRLEIWNLNHQGIGTDEIIQKLYTQAPVGVSESQFKRCVRSIKGKPNPPRPDK